MLNILAKGLVIVGVCILGFALIPVRQLIAQLPPGSMRRRWYVLTALIFLFIVGYLGFAVTFWSQQTTWPDIVVPSIFFLGAGFVWLTVTLSLQTAADLGRLLLLEHENITDPVVGIFNRRYLNRRLDEESARARRYNLPLAVLLIDIDRFKLINDTYGHQVGDVVLNNLGDLLLQAIRPSDIAARYGGEEMFIIAPNTTSDSAGVLAERIRQHIEAHRFIVMEESDKTQEISITVSIGVASRSQKTTDSRLLINNADEALYCAKREGRNRVVTYSDIGRKFASKVK
ncbi:MAG: GGDEF domain-containing protein [Desulfobacterales bacterium]|nr:GGDEF domain-containing protein [Deltaproteobacteria bacterium]NNK95083.1 GGDEF domain-containing protein [Desulfobacterales bacterium]